MFFTSPTAPGEQFLWNLSASYSGVCLNKPNSKAHRPFFEFSSLTRNMLFIIQNDLNVHSFPLKPVIFCKKSHFGAKLA
jgi:hypothetical protein